MHQKSITCIHNTRSPDRCKICNRLSVSYPMVKKICPICFQSFAIYGYTQQYCSTTCANRRGLKSPNATCAVCKKKFHCRPSDIKEKVIKYCSKKCVGISRRINPQTIVIVADYQRFKKYGLTREDVFKILKEQNNKCKICYIKIYLNKNRKDNLCVDHDHNSGEVRGLLCRHCNWGLGHFKDNINNLYNAIQYLKTQKNHIDI